MKSKENLKLEAKQLREKYGDAIVMCVPHEPPITEFLNGYIPAKGNSGLIIQLNRKLAPALRCEAELDSSLKQVIPYVVLTHNGKLFCTKRLGGDARLKGAYSIGTGGHIDNGETIYQAMYRELAEEVGVGNADIFCYTVEGFINDNTSEVNKVHLGVVIKMYIKNEDISCIEKDKLEGKWMDVQELKKLDDKGALESWSSIVLHEIVNGRF